MSENLKKFLDLLGSDKELEAKALACNELGEEKGREAMLALAKECGIELTAADLAEDARVSTMLVKSGLCKSQSEARNQIKAGAVSVAEEKVSDMNATISAEQFGEDGLMLQKGKKGFRRLILK